jgi:hypothetical protein
MIDDEAMIMLSWINDNILIEYDANPGGNLSPDG